MNIFCDIDGTLTEDGKHKYGSLIVNRIDALRKLSIQHDVILWSGNGKAYAKEFQKRNHFRPMPGNRQTPCDYR